jgi:hypothetical protein
MPNIEDRIAALPARILRSCMMFKTQFSVLIFYWSPQLILPVLPSRFPIGIGLALVVGVMFNYFISPRGSLLLLFGGALLVVLAIVVDAMAYRRRETRRFATLKATPPSRAKMI